MKSHLPRLKPKIIKYRSYKTFDAGHFLSDIKLTKFGASDDPHQAYNDLVCTFRKLVDKHAPQKTKVLRGKSASFMTRKLRKEIYTRTRLLTRYKKNPTKENERKLKRQIYKCVSF